MNFDGRGRPPVALPCPRCGRTIGMFFNGMNRWQQGKHKKPGGGWCREVREAVTGRVLNR